MQIEFEIKYMRPTTGLMGSGNERLASFQVDMFPFYLRGAAIARRKDGTIYAALPGKRKCGWSIVAPELRQAIIDTAVEHWRIRHE